jgi:hypothetical protein
MEAYLKYGQLFKVSIGFACSCLDHWADWSAWHIGGGLRLLDAEGTGHMRLVVRLVGTYSATMTLRNNYTRSEGEFPNGWYRPRLKVCEEGFFQQQLAGSPDVRFISSSPRVLHLATYIIYFSHDSSLYKVPQGKSPMSSTSIPRSPGMQWNSDS